MIWRACALLNDDFGFSKKLLRHILRKKWSFFLPLKMWQYRILLISFPFHRTTSYLHLVLQKSLRDILWFPCSRFRKCPKMSSTQRSVQKEDNFLQDRSSETIKYLQYIELFSSWNRLLTCAVPASDKRQL